MNLKEKIEEINRYRGVLNNLYKEKEKLEKKKQELLEYKREIYKEIDLGYYNIFKYSCFQADVIGENIAKLLTNLEQTPYIYKIINIKPSCDETLPFLDMYYNELYYEGIPIRVILEKTYTNLDKTINLDEWQAYLKQTPTIIVDKNADKNGSTVLKNEINLYNFELALNLNTKFHNHTFIHYFDVPEMKENQYKIIKEYIDSLVDYRIENDLEEISKEEINAFLDTYLENKKQKIKRKEVKQ